MLLASVAFTALLSMAPPTRVHARIWTADGVVAVARRIRDGESMRSVLAKMLPFGPPTFPEGKRRPFWAVQVFDRGAAHRVTVSVSLDESERVTDVWVVWVASPDQTGVPAASTGGRMLYRLRFDKTARSTWGGVAVGQLHWGMGPADAIAECPFRVEDLVGVMNLPCREWSPDELEAVVRVVICVPTRSPEAEPVTLAFLNGRLAEYSSWTPLPSQSPAPRDSKEESRRRAAWVDQKRSELVKRFGQPFRVPSDEEKVNVERSLAEHGEPRFMTWAWKAPQAFVVLHDSGGTGFSCVLYRDPSMGSVE